MRNSFDKEFQNLVYRPQTQQASIVDLTTSSLGETEFVKPEYTAEYWLSDKSNHKVLKNIIDGLSEGVEEVKVFQNNEDKSIYLMFQHKEKNYSLSFPTDFPQSKPVIKEVSTEAEIIIDANGKEWNPEEEISKSTIAFTENILGIKKKNFFQTLLSK